MVYRVVTCSSTSSATTSYHTINHMFNPIFDSVQTSQLIRNRIARIANQLRSFKAYTQVDYQAEVYSAVNGVLNLGNKMTPPVYFAGQTPATVGNINTYLGNLNNDGNDVAAEVTSIETQIAQYYNLSAGVQNTLRQTIREQVYASIANQYIEAFVNDVQMQLGYTANLDFNAGVATCPL